MRKLAFVILLFFVGAATAVDKPHGPFGNIQLMEAMGSLVAMTADLGVQAGQLPDESDNLNQLAGYFRKGLVEARGHTDLTAALKDYYSAMRAYLTGLNPQADEAKIVYNARISGLETNVNNAKARLDVELQALGVNP